MLMIDLLHHPVRIYITELKRRERKRNGSTTKWTVKDLELKKTVRVFINMQSTEVRSAVVTQDEAEDTFSCQV